MDSFSPETTINTDMTVTAESETQRTATQTFTNRNKLIHDIQLLKMELAQKELIMERIKVDHLSRIEDLEEKLADVVYQKQILQLRLEAQLQFVETTSKEKESALRDEIQKLKAKHVESNDDISWKMIKSIKEHVSDPALYESHYKHLQGKSHDDITAEDRLLLLIYERIFANLEKKNAAKEAVKIRDGNDGFDRTGVPAEPADTKDDTQTLPERMYMQKIEETQVLKKKVATMHKENCEMQQELMKWRMLCEETEDSVAQLQLELQSYKQVKDELLNKLTDIRKKYRQTYASTFRQEVDSIKVQLQQEIGQLRQELEQAASEKASYEIWKRKSVKQISHLQNDLRETRRTKNGLEEQLEEQKNYRLQLTTLHKDVANELEQQIMENRRLRMKIEVLKQEVEKVQAEQPVHVSQRRDTSNRLKSTESSNKKDADDFQRQLGIMSSEMAQLKSEHAKLQDRHLELIADMNTILGNRKAMEKITEKVTTLEKQLVAGNNRSSNIPEVLSITKPERTLH